MEKIEQLMQMFISDGYEITKINSLFSYKRTNEKRTDAKNEYHAC